VKKKRISVIDYDIGNVKSILRALEKVGAEPVLSREDKEILSSDAAVFPGVGAFSVGMENLRRYDLIDTIYRFVETGKPFLGICLGMQILMEESEEFVLTKGMGLLKGRVVRLIVEKSCDEKIPHVGWNKIEEPEEKRWKGTIFNSIKNPSSVYFVHSFMAQPSDPADILSTTVYGGNAFCSAVNRGNIYGCQFHPEKSAVTGLRILNDFVGLIK